ncbi:MAG: STAS domain-containing protein [Anaerolinea sp.]|nr:STAS domain-containing protein [Anaerolinea sp.]
MSSALKVVTRSAASASVIELHGDVNSDGDAAIKGAYRDAVTGGATTILFNLSKTEYINTSGISVLIAIVMEAKKAGQKILVCGVSPHYKKVFDLVRFSVYVTMFDTEDAALASLAETPPAS